jgi:hypothetical protein
VPPLQGGEFTGEMNNFYVSSLIPLLGGVPPQGGVVGIRRKSNVHVSAGRYFQIYFLSSFKIIYKICIVTTADLC